MFNISRILGHRRDNGADHSSSSTGNQNGAGTQDGADEREIRVLVITSDAEYYANLQNIASRRGWTICRNATVEEGIAAVREAPFLIVVYDSNAPNSDWQRAFQRLNALQTPLCILLASRVGDPYLWQEVIRSGGFDLLPRSAPEEDLIRTLRFAWFSKRGMPTPPESPNRGSHVA